MRRIFSSAWMQGTLRILFCLILLGLADPPQPASANTSLIDSHVNYVFGQQITFQARFESTIPIQQVAVLFSAQGDPHTESGIATLQADGEAVFKFELKNYTLRPFSKVQYRYRLELEQGEPYLSDYLSFDYIDNRFAWQNLDDAPFRVFWYAGDIAFAQEALDVAQQGLQRAQTLLPVDLKQSMIDIYVYDSATDMQAALEPEGEAWIAGHADPSLGVMIVALPAGPDQRLRMAQRIPHELMHILLYEVMGGSYQNLPIWLNEGLATSAELYPNPDYQVLLKNAYQKNSLLPINSLCEVFPRDVSNALLAYAQSASFTNYIHQRFGKSGILALVQNYGNGLSCERGVEAALGKSMAQLERQWRGDTFSENALSTALGNMLPWLVLPALILGIPLVLALLRGRKTNGKSVDEALHFD
jgi:Peptidase MA superfamily